MKITNSKHTELIGEIGKLFFSIKDMNILLKTVLELLAKYFPVERGMINIYIEESDEIHIDVSYGYSKDQIVKGIYKSGEGIIGSVISSGEPVIVPSIFEEPKFLNRTGARMLDPGHNIAFICVPVKISGETLGTISIDLVKDKNDSFKEEVEMLSMVSVMVAHAVNNRREMLQTENHLREENKLLKIKLNAGKSPGSMIGNSHIIRAINEKVILVAETDSTVLITGESGTGKELIAEAIHYNSKRKDKSFIRVNIAALSQSLIESELFGHEKGSFTGAVSQKKGKFELANEGTIFLDEIGDLNPQLQVHLLRVIQEKTIERVGGNKTIPLNVRILAATHQNLEEKIRNNEFRADLYYRLNVFPIYAPPLRERKTDIMLLSDYFLEKYSQKIGKDVKRISSEAIDMLMSYHWPGNVRELENSIERAVILADGDVIRSYHLPPSLQIAEEPEKNGMSGNLEEMTDMFVKEIIIDHLKLTKGNISKAANLLGTTKRILNYKIKKLGIDFKKYY
ncbi:MAG: sigma 54-interacting transcriptional regulator [Spirochaetes bacterium]|nr:sigma 54-interacting transcriptional regulator [Spirochaetota bacterium]